MEIRRELVHNGDGWRLELKQTFDREKLNPDARPLLIVPGYGMNSFIFGYHPRGLSMEAYLAQAGFEVWSVNLRGQGGSECEGGSKNHGLRELSLVDLPIAVDFVADHNLNDRNRVDLIGCSLGGTIVYTYAALKSAHRVGSIVGMGAPLSWVEIHPALRFAFGSPFIAGLLRIKHTRTIARMGLPIIARIPWILSIYLHPEIVDLSHPEILSQTVEDPHPQLNREISRWIIDRDLIIDGQNVSDSFASVNNPLYLMLCNADGIVPVATAMTAYDLAGSKVKDSIVVGTDDIPMAHADMYISDYAQQFVFSPLAKWLFEQNGD